MMGKEGDATPFTTVNVESISDMLHQSGYQKRGNEVKYKGHTGRKVEAKIFLGPRTTRGLSTWWTIKFTRAAEVPSKF